VLANDTISMIFQVLVVILEIAAGLMLLGGAFTFAGGLISFALMGMFITSTGLYEKSWWMIFASIAVMGGAGRAFGLDYYLLPYLNNLWDRFRKSGKLGLFFRHSLHRDD
jgi:NADH dehydrogenase